MYTFILIIFIYLLLLLFSLQVANIHDITLISVVFIGAVSVIYGFVLAYLPKVIRKWINVYITPPHAHLF